MNLKLTQTVDQAKLTLYWNDTIIYSGIDSSIESNFESNDGWNCLIIECERLSPSNNYGKVIVNEILINGTNEWPVDAGTAIINIPFCFSQGFFYTEYGSDYLSYDTIHTNSYQRIFFKISNDKIVDHYYDRGPENPEAYNIHSTQNLTSQKLDPNKYHLIWSDVYKKYVHRLVHQDHCIFYVDLSKLDTFSSKWLGVRIETTKSALAENQARYPTEHFPIGSDFLTDLSGFKNWPFYHVFGAYHNRPLPKELLDLILEIV